MKAAIGRLCAAKDAVDIRRGLPILENEVGAVRHETASRDEKADRMEDAEGPGFPLPAAVAT